MSHSQTWTVGEDVFEFFECYELFRTDYHKNHCRWNRLSKLKPISSFDWQRLLKLSSRGCIPREMTLDNSCQSICRSFRIFVRFCRQSTFFILFLTRIIRTLLALQCSLFTALQECRKTARVLFYLFFLHQFRSLRHTVIADYKDSFYFSCNKVVPRRGGFNPSLKLLLLCRFPPIKSSVPTYSYF